MKKLLLTLIVSLAFCGSIFAQPNPQGYESHWPDFYDPDYAFQEPFVCAIQIDGELITLDSPNWFALEVAAFVGDDECRGNIMFLTDEYVLEYEDPYLTIDGFPIYYNEVTGDVVYFKMYDHLNQIEYTQFEITYLGEPYTVYTGTPVEEGWDDPENPVILNFISPASEGYTLEIDPYEYDKDNYYLIASPVGEISASAVQGLRTPAFDFYAFDQSADLEWINLRDNEDFMLQPGVGYLYANNTGTDLVFNGTPAYQPGDVAEFDLEYDPAAGDFPGWNLVGNPFADDAYILCRDFYMLNGETFETMLQESSTIVPAMTGAFVEADGEDDYVTFSTELGGVNCSVVGEDDKIVLDLSKGRSVIDRAIVRFGEGRTLHKFQIRNSSKVYFTVDNEDYAVVRSANQGEMPVSFKAEKSGSYTLNVNAKGMNYLHLIDNLTGADVDLLANPGYTFDASTTDYASRFKLVFATGDADDTFAFASNGSFVISNEGNATVQVIDVNGRILSSETINGSASINFSAAPGVYMIRLINGDNVKVQKVVVK